MAPALFGDLGRTHRDRPSLKGASISKCPRPFGKSRTSFLSRSPFCRVPSASHRLRYLSFFAPIKYVRPRMPIVADRSAARSIGAARPVIRSPQKIGIISEQLLDRIAFAMTCQTMTQPAASS